MWRRTSIATTRDNAWIFAPQPDPDAVLRLFCFPYAGGGASIFHDWPHMLPPEVELCALQLPGRESRRLEAPYTELPHLVEDISIALQPYLQKPFAFFGHSMGALISFELTRLLRRNGGPLPKTLFISGHQAPNLPPPERMLPAQQSSDKEFIAMLRRLNGTPEEVLQHAELMNLLLPTLRADFLLCERYVYHAEPPLSCPINVFGGMRDTITKDELNAWKNQTEGDFSCHLFPGGHFFLHSSREVLLHQVSQDLKKFIEVR